MRKKEILCIISDRIRQFDSSNEWGQLSNRLLARDIPSGKICQFKYVTGNVSTNRNSGVVHCTADGALLNGSGLMISTALAVLRMLAVHHTSSQYSMKIF